MQLFWVYQWFAWSCLWETIATSCENSIILMTSKGAVSSSANSTNFDGNRVLVVVIGISFFEKRRWGEARWNPWKVLHWKDANCWTWLGLGSKKASIRGFSRSKCYIRFFPCDCRKRCLKVTNSQRLPRHFRVILTIPWPPDLAWNQRVGIATSCSCGNSEGSHLSRLDLLCPNLWISNHRICIIKVVGLSKRERYWYRNYQPIVRWWLTKISALLF